jgi:hypothetical protein
MIIKRPPVGLSHEAEEYVDAAWDSISDSEAAKLARKALLIDPNVYDAYIIISRTLPTFVEKIALLRDGVNRGRKVWSEAIANSEHYDFWLDIYTRPFMRTVHELALLTWDFDDRTEAIDLAKLLLRLNPEDNQGARYLLLSWLPVIDDWGAVELILSRYADENGTYFSYAKCLNAFRKNDLQEALVSNAVAANPYVAYFLKDARRQVNEVSQCQTMGSTEEAFDYASLSREAWLSVNGAISWLTKSTKSFSK